MNHVKKMILVPQETVARLHETPALTPQTQMSSLDTEMNGILNKKYADDSEKWKHYSEALQRYLHFAGETRKPLSLEIESVPEKPSDSADPNGSSQIRQQVASVLPKTYKEQALKIHDYLAVSGSPVTWDAQGVVSIKNTRIPHSNIIDWISDLTRYRKNFEPHGINQFVYTLAELNIPLELIGNEKRRAAVLQAKQSGGGIISAPLQKKIKTNTVTTRVAQKLTRPKKKHGWKPW